MFSQTKGVPGAHPGQQQARRHHRRTRSHLRQAPAEVRRAGRPRHAACWPAASRRTGRSPSRSRSGSATAPAPRSTTPTATSTSTCTAATAPPWPATPTRPSSRRSATRSSAAPTSRSRRENAIAVAGELARRWGLPRWRFANSGTEATMDAVHLMRSYTGRDLIIKVEGGYHGHHDSVQVSVMPDPDEAGPRGPAPPGPVLAPASPPRSPASRWSPSSTTSASVARLLDAHRGQVAGMIVEPVMMNAGIIPPAARLPGRPAGTCCTPTARCSRSTRSRPASRSAPAASPRSRASSRTSSAWPSRSAGEWRSPPIGGTRRADGPRRRAAATRWSAPSTATRSRWPRPARC